jgi:hypothetical protein
MQHLPNAVYQTLQSVACCHVGVLLCTASAFPAYHWLLLTAAPCLFGGVRTYRSLRSAQTSRELDCCCFPTRAA